MTIIFVAGLGSEYRRDDGAGVAVVRRVEALLAAGDAGDDGDRAAGVVAVAPLHDPLDLLGRWDEADLAVVVDATRSGAEPGTVHVLELPGAGSSRSAAHGVGGTHGLGVPDVVALARAVDCAPSRVVVVGVEGLDFTDGTGLSPPVDAAVERAAHAVLALVGTAADGALSGP